MKFLVCSLVTIFLSSSSFAQLKPAEKNYLETRDRLIKSFENSKHSRDKEDQKSLKNLEKSLREILGESRVEGFSGQGTINIQTLQKEPGVDMVDGLNYKTDTEVLFMTNLNLLNSYIEHHPKLPKDLVALSKNELFYSEVFDWDSSFIQFSDVPFENTKDIAQAFLTVNSQEVGPFVPSTLTLMAKSKSRIYVVKVDLKDQISQIPECKNAWDEFEKKSDAAFEAYQTSKSKKAWAEHIKYEKDGFSAFRSCYEKEVKNQKEFAAIKTRAQSILDRIQKN